MSAAAAWVAETLFQDMHRSRLAPLEQRQKAFRTQCLMGPSMSFRAEFPMARGMLGGRVLCAGTSARCWGLLLAVGTSAIFLEGVLYS